MGHLRFAQDLSTCLQEELRMDLVKEVSADASFRQVIDSAGRRQRLAFAELDRRAARWRLRVRLCGVLALAAGWLLLTTWLGWISFPDVGLVAAILAGATGFSTFLATNPAEERRAKELLQCAVKFGQLSEWARSASQRRFSAPGTAQKIVDELNAEYAKLVGEADTLTRSQGAPERGNIRFRPKNVNTSVTLRDGCRYPAILIDLSPSGAAIAIEARAPVGAKVRVGRTEARVIRTFKSGFAVEFLQSLPQAYDRDFAL
jgi:hypothetical protein